MAPGWVRLNRAHDAETFLLFHTLFIVSPVAGQKLLGSAQVGEYFREFIAFAVIGVTLALHAWKRGRY